MRRGKCSRIDGTGYHRHLKGDDLTIQMNILAIMDIFEALTAQDRPYKTPMPIPKALEILKEEVNAVRLDSDIFDIFVDEKIYNRFETDLQVIFGASERKLFSM